MTKEAIALGSDNKHYGERLKKENWLVKEVPLSVAQNLVKKLHYSRGGSNTRTYTHGLFHKNNLDVCLGVAWWIPPTKTAANASFPENWRGVLALSRMVVEAGVPKNACSFLLSKSQKMIDRVRWPCLVTYADDWQGHTGTIYKASNWKYVGKTGAEATYTLDGRMIARKAGPKTRTHAEMLELGAVLLGRFAKHKFTHIVQPKTRSQS